MANSKRVTLSDRRAAPLPAAPQGVDAIITATPPNGSNDGDENDRTKPAAVSAAGAGPLATMGGGSDAAAGAAGLSKVTLYVRPEQVLAIEEIQVAERRRTGKRRDKSDLVQEALDLLIQKYVSTSDQQGVIR